MPTPTLQELSKLSDSQLRILWGSLDPAGRQQLMAQLSPKATTRTTDQALQADRARKGAARAAGQDIGPIDAIVDPERRHQARWSLQYHLEAYHPETFGLAWASYHLRLIELAQLCILKGGWFANAVPRGGGKTALVQGAVEWAILHGHKFYPVLIGANEDMALESLISIKRQLLTNPQLHADFPEICQPIVALDDEARRAAGQICCGARTRMEWGTKSIVLPTIPEHEYQRWLGTIGDQELWPVDVAGSRIRAFGLTGSFRGLSATTAKLRSIRPDLAIADDPQTRESARSLSQSAQRSATLKGDVAYLSGPTSTMSLLIPCTVIYKDDLADQMLDRERSPEFHGERHKMLESLPTNMDLWDRYAEIIRRCQRLDQPLDDATAYYVENREAMDEGAVASWPARHPGCVSAIEFAMRLRIQDPASFEAEAQNNPIGAAQSETIYVKSADIQQKQHHLGHGEVPLWATKLSAHIDVQQRLLYYAVCAGSPEFEVACIDYGSFPKQNRRYFQYVEDLHDFEQVYPELRPEDQVYAALTGAFQILANQTYVREDGVEMRIDRILVDCGFLTATVVKACRQSDYRAILLPTKGMAVKAKERPISEWNVKPPAERGHEYVIKPSPSMKRDRICQPNQNYWKSQVHGGFATLSGPGSLSLWKDEPERHRMIADQCNAEFPTRVKVDDNEVDEWQAFAHRPDNHLFDNLVGCLVGLSVCGCALPSAHDSHPSRGRRQRRTFSGRPRK